MPADDGAAPVGIEPAQRFVKAPRSLPFATALLRAVASGDSADDSLVQRMTGAGVVVPETDGIVHVNRSSVSRIRPRWARHNARAKVMR